MADFPFVQSEAEAATSVGRTATWPATAPVLMLEEEAALTEAPARAGSVMRRVTLPVTAPAEVVEAAVVEAPATSVGKVDTLHVNVQTKARARASPGTATEREARAKTATSVEKHDTLPVSAPRRVKERARDQGIRVRVRGDGTRKSGG